MGRVPFRSRAGKKRGLRARAFDAPRASASEPGMTGESGRSGEKSGQRKRLAEALRENLKRRKAQQRKRSAATDANAGGGRKTGAKESGRWTESES